MKERTSSTITVQRFNRTQRKWVNVIEVPLTENCRRKFTLMQEDCINIDFVYDRPVSLLGGDRVVDEIFGTFYLMEQRIPQYDSVSGQYRYSATFVADYMRLNNYLCMLTYQPIGDSYRQRKETNWTLTGSLDEHIDEIVNGINTFSTSVPYSYDIDHSQITSAKEAKCIQYDSMYILDALRKVCDEYECEWWIGRESNTIHIGKCEYGAEPIDFIVGESEVGEENVMRMNISRDRQEYASKLYVFGSQNNIPSTYRKQLYVVAETEYQAHKNRRYFIPNHKLTRDMFGTAESAKFPVLSAFELVSQTATKFVFDSHKVFVNVNSAGEYRFTGGNIAVNCNHAACNNYNGLINITLEARAETPSFDILLASTTVSKSVHTDPAYPLIDIGIHRVPMFDVKKTIEAGSTSVYIRMVVELPSADTNFTNVTTPYKEPLTTEYINATSTRSGVTGIVKAHYNNEDVYVLINPYDYEKGEELYYAMSLCNSAGQTIPTPDGFGKGSVLLIDDSDSVLIPSAFYASSYDDPTALARVGERRLMLPDYDEDGTPTYGTISRTNNDFDREMVVIFDNIYPDGKLLISNIEAEEKKDHTEYEGENLTNDWQWEEYSFKANLANGSVFPFKEKYILPNTKLQVRFLTHSDMGWGLDEHPDNCKLAGMTFDLQFNRAQNSYTIVRNSDYGTMLPNAVLHPNVGDPCVLIGWNVKSMSELSLIEDAERRLLAKGREYLNAMQEGQYTFDCTMMNSFMFDAIPYIRLHTSNDEPVDDVNGKHIYVKNNYDVYSIPTEGTKVRINHNALSKPKLSRIIGYELKLDKPYDAPRFIVGETQAYSRLAQLEKKITKTNK